MAGASTKTLRFSKSSCEKCLGPQLRTQSLRKLLGFGGIGGLSALILPNGAVLDRFLAYLKVGSVGTRSRFENQRDHLDLREPVKVPMKPLNPSSASKMT